nr:MAG TPA: hypothetical protein [Caudoviricetes sp.]
MRLILASRRRFTARSDQSKTRITRPLRASRRR